VTVPEAELRRGEHGLEPAGAGWFVMNATEAPWIERRGRGAYAEFEGFDGGADFSQLGINVTVLNPGEPMAMYHYENDQEDFLVLSGEATLVIEGRERALRRWDLVHCPAGTQHVIVGAGTGPCAVLCVGARTRSVGPDWGGYTVDEAAIRLGAGVEQPTADPDVAYARFGDRERSRYRAGWLPE
jgi:uncharacterized cupin superfamily protein